jgi:hypothetical protein
VNTSRPASTLFIEFKEDSVHVLDRDGGFDLPLARDARGNISVETGRELLRVFAGFEGRKACCSIPARGVSLRVLSLPAGTSEETERMLPLQVEAHFPLAPSELAWGYSPKEGANGKPGLQELLVAAVKREILEEYRGLVAGLEASFTIGALARCALAANPPRAFSLLDADKPRSELISFDAAGSVHLRALANSDVAFAALGEKVYVTGANGAGRQIADELALNGSSEIIETPPGPGRTAANLGLRKLCETFGVPPLTLEVARVEEEPRKNLSSWKWPVLAAALFFAFLTLRVLEPIVQRPRFANRLADLQHYRDSLPAIDRELAFLQYIKTNQPPYLDAITALASAAPRGTRFESVSMARRGDLNVRGSMENPGAATEFRSKLIESGLFSKLVLEEQSPLPNGQKITFRISAQMNLDDARKPSSTNANQPTARQESKNAPAH